MKWEKLGLIFKANGQRPWMVSHASVPVAEHVEGDVFRIYFTPRDERNHSHIAWLLIDITEPQRILQLCDEPLLAPGPPGAFDDCGAMSSWVIAHEGTRYHYFIGWNVRNTVQFQTSVGLAHSPQDVVAIERRLDGPVLDRIPLDPYYSSTPCVIVEGDVWKMWYQSGVGWETLNGRETGSYNIRYAEGSDGIAWIRDAAACIDFEHPEEIAITRPCVLRDGSRYRMWYCYRGRNFAYRVGYAESPNGRGWSRMDDQAGIGVSASGWDSEMVAYPFVFDHKQQRYMLYCGNGFSREGFGLAALTAA